jgi:hypothetical protein
MDTDAPCAHAKDCNIRRIAAEILDMMIYPFEGVALVNKSVVSNRVSLAPAVDLFGKVLGS